MDISAGLAALKTGFELSKSISEQVKQAKIDPNEICSRLLVLQQYMLDSQEALNGAREELQGLKEALATAQQQAAITRDLEFVSDGGFYIRKSERVNGSVIPYCPLCWGNGQKLVPLNPTNGQGFYRCVLHNFSHTTRAYQAWEARQQTSGFYAPPDDGPDSWMR